MDSTFESREWSGFKLESFQMEGTSGMWAGSRPLYHILTHEASGLCVRWTDLTHKSQFTAREAARACLEMLIDELEPGERP